MRSRPFATALSLALLAAAVLVPGGASAGTSHAHSCKQVDVKFGETEGSATRIRALNISCRSARKVVRSCMLEHRPRGWSVVTNTKGVTHMRSRTRRISYRPAGGGGCGKVE